MKTILIVVLLLSLLLNGWLFWDRAKSEKDKVLVNREWQDKIDKHAATAKTYRDSAHLERVKRIHGDSLAKSRENSLKMRVAAHEKNLIKQRIPIQPLIDSIQALGDFVETYDSLSTAKDSLIFSLNTRIDTLQTSFNREIRHIERAYANQQQISKLWEGQANNFQALYQEADRKAKKKFTIGPFIGYGIGDSGLTPAAGISLQYTLFRF